MNLKEALKTIGIDDILNINTEELKKKYKRLMIKYHPDNYSGDDTKAKEIVEANNIILSALKEIESYNSMIKASQIVRIRSIITLDRLIDIYNGKTIEFNIENEEPVIVSQENLFKHSIFVIFDFNVTANGLVEHFTHIKPVEMMRNYKVDCEIMVPDMSPLEVDVEILEEKRHITINYDSLTLPIKLSNDIKVMITLKKTCMV